jgi:hypothetical protein
MTRRPTRNGNANDRSANSRNGVPGEEGPAGNRQPLKNQQVNHGPDAPRSGDGHSGECRSGRSQARSRDQTSALYEEIARLHATIQSLRATGEALEAECRRLLEENQKLRRQATLAAHADDLERALRRAGHEEEPGENGDAGAGAESTESGASGEQASILPLVPPQAEGFYRELPGRITFPAFFQFAEESGLGKGPARRCLMHYLREKMLVQSGAYLRKPGVG